MRICSVARIRLVPCMQREEAAKFGPGPPMFVDIGRIRLDFGPASAEICLISAMFWPASANIVRFYRIWATGPEASPERAAQHLAPVYEARQVMGRTSCLVSLEDPDHGRGLQDGKGGGGFCSGANGA